MKLVTALNTLRLAGIVLLDWIGGFSAAESRVEEDGELESVVGESTSEGLPAVLKRA
jgi:hypothetical protein